MKNIIKIISLIIIMIVITSAHCSSFGLDTSITGDKFISDLNPNQLSETGEQMVSPVVELIQTVVNAVLGFLQIIGGILTVVSLAAYGITMLLGGNEGLAKELGMAILTPKGDEKKKGPEAKMEMLRVGRKVLIGAILLFSGSTIVKLVFKIVFI